MLEKLMSLFPADNMTNSVSLINFAHQLVQFLEKNIQDDSMRNEAIDLFTSLLQQQKK